MIKAISLLYLLIFSIGNINASDLEKGRLVCASDSVEFGGICGVLLSCNKEECEILTSHRWSKGEAPYFLAYEWNYLIRTIFEKKRRSTTVSKSNIFEMKKTLKEVMGEIITIEETTKKAVKSNTQSRGMIACLDSYCGFIKHCNENSCTVSATFSSTNGVPLPLRYIHTYTRSKKEFYYGDGEAPTEVQSSILHFLIKEKLDDIFFEIQY